MLRLREPNYCAFKVLPYRVFAACFIIGSVVGFWRSLRTGRASNKRQSGFRKPATDLPNTRSASVVLNRCGGIHRGRIGDAVHDSRSGAGASVDAHATPRA